MSFGSVSILSNRSEIFYSKMRILCLHNRFIFFIFAKRVLWLVHNGAGALKIVYAGE